MFKLAVIAIVIQQVAASCCYTLTSKSTSTSNFQLQVAVVSTIGSTTKNVTLTFPNTYLINSYPQACQLSSTVQGAVQCTNFEQQFNGSFAVYTPGNPQAVPQFQVQSNADEICVLAQSKCDGFKDQTVATASPPSPGGNGFINMGALGYVAPGTFYPVLITSILFVCGMGYMFITRIRRTSPTGADIERQEDSMTHSRNKAGWFGEPGVAADASGFSSFNRTQRELDAKKKRESSKPAKDTDVKRTPSVINNKQSRHSAVAVKKPAVANRKSTRANDSDSEDDSKVVKKVPQSKKPSQSSRQPRRHGSDEERKSPPAKPKKPLVNV